MSRVAAPSVVYVAPDKMGGVISSIANLVAYRPPGGLPAHVVLTHNAGDPDTRFGRALPGASIRTVEYALPVENLHAVMRRVAAAVPAGDGVYVASDLLDLATASVHDFRRAIVQIVHGDSDYYIDLAARHEPVVHAYIAISRRIEALLARRMPHRRDTIFYLPHGVPLPGRVRGATSGPLSLVYAGRLDDSQKCVMDLPAIDAALRDRGVPRRWTVFGGGPDESRLRDAWRGSPDVHFAGAVPHFDMIERFADHDVFVLPTRNEGLPVALLEAMAAGVVPVVSRITSGVPDIVEDGVSGYMPEVGNIKAFADAVARLDADRERLAAMRSHARRVVEARFEVRACAAAYEALYGRWRELYRPLRASHLQYGSRLDRVWLPNSLVRLVRTAVRSTR